MEGVSVNPQSSLLALLMLLATACEEPASDKEQDTKKREVLQPENVVAPDLLEGWDWSTDELNELISRAEAGETAAGRRVYEYYVVNENDERREYWNNWLIERGDKSAMIVRAHEFYESARKRSNLDPQKLTELRESEAIYLESVDDDQAPFITEIQSEIASTEEGARLQTSYIACCRQ